MLAYFTRHQSDKQGSTWSDQGKGWQAWQGWGGDAGFAWARKVVNQMNAADKKAQALRAYSEALSAQHTYDIPDGLTIGRPFKTLSLGQVSSRMSGKDIGKEITMEMLSEMVRVFHARRAEDPVVIDWQHATSPYQDGPPAPPESGNALGLIADLELREDGFDRAGGSHVGTAQLLAVTLTPRPAQSHSKIDRVTLNERFEDMDLANMDLDELREMLIAKDEMVKRLEDQIKDMKKDAESKISADSEALEEHDKDKEEKMGEDEDKEKKMGEDKKDHYKMSETVSPELLSEFNALREKNEEMAKRLETIEQEKREIEKREAVSALLRDGRIEPSQENVAGKAWELREVQPEFWQMFSERPAGSSIPLQEVGHGASGREINRQSLDAEIKKLAAEKSISYSEALNQFRTSNPDFYTKAFGG
jgi:hypothetical protein